ncbi:hypothetical protein [Streptomyces antimicrobicus]|uniref:Uncharacterized protein n=1 Tax=Streptomyces antimicrobicus TaxID=2883108 RepID=A0ABS8B460_9ACTN|nr:hypothetical protein [Streptomyces antimicrobicus]MCB5179393.1 hypothetical protein [Streptomyces antimicrobicus]
MQSTTEEEVFHLGQDCEVELELVFQDEYQGLLNSCDRIELFDGSRLIAIGQWIDDGEPGDRGRI